MRAKDLSGQKFGKLLVIESAPPIRSASGRSTPMWRCACDCGAVNVMVSSRNLRTDTRSCGCKRREGRALTHGYARRGHRHPLYATWLSMIDRCRNPNNCHWERYGGRGISVCARWVSDFSAFLFDMGEKPSKAHSIDRINNDGNYEPDNCRWATANEQALNRRRGRRRPRILMEDGTPLTEAAISKGLHPSTVWRRYRVGHRGEALFATSLAGRHNSRRKGVPRPNMLRDESTKRFIGKRMDGTVVRR